MLMLIRLFQSEDIEYASLTVKNEWWEDLVTSSHRKFLYCNKIRWIAIELFSSQRSVRNLLEYEYNLEEICSIPQLSRFYITLLYFPLDL